MRDILQQNRKAGRDEETAALIESRFDLVLVHGDERLARLDETFPLAWRFADKIRHTGLVAPPAPEPRPQRFTVTVSAGGGAAGAKLIRAALLAKPQIRAPGDWLMLTGPNAADKDWQAYEAMRPPGIELKRFVPDLAAALAASRVSVSQAGYNTVADILAAGAASVLVPFAEGGETEQPRRAAALEARGAALVISEAALTPERLAEAIDRAAGMRPAALKVSLDGAAETARILGAALSARRSA